MRLENKVAILTGAVGGIGLAVVDKFIAEGAKVLAVDVNQEALTALEAKYPDNVKGLVADVTDYQKVESMVDTAVEKFGTLDIMLNNAGIGSAKMLMDHDPATDFDITTKVNQHGVYYGILAAGRKFKALDKPGVIINTSSIYAECAAEMTFSYNVSKAAVTMMTTQTKASHSASNSPLAAQNASPSRDAPRIAKMARHIILELPRNLVLPSANQIGPSLSTNFR